MQFVKDALLARFIPVNLVGNIILIFISSLKINYKNLNKLTKILLDNIKSEFKDNNEKLAIFYINIDNKKYYKKVKSILNSIFRIFQNKKE